MQLNNTRQKGSFGEKIAKNYLVRNGYKIVFSNFEINKKGEIDIIATRGNDICFVEVKYRKSDKFGDPIEAITSFKLGRIYRSIDYFVHQNSQYRNFTPVIVCLGILEEGYNRYKISEYRV